MSNSIPLSSQSSEAEKSTLNIIRKGKKGPGGRKIHREYSHLSFDSYRLENNKLAAKCKICGTVVKNTAVTRLRLHR